MKISLRKTSLVDYPGKIAGTLFFPGCTLRCPWCHNRDLVLGSEQVDNAVSLDEALRYLEKRRAVLGGVVLSGGEATLYGELPGLVRRIKELSLSVKIDTNGMEPAMLERLLQTRETKPDYIALDLKVAPWRYAFLGPHIRDPKKLLETSAAFIRGSGIPHEFRTLAFPHGFVTPADVESLAPLVDDAPWYFRPFRPGTCLDPAWNNLEPAEPADIEILAQKAQALGKRGICPQ
jgi:pyruvate formate lyase activating enzyme